MGVRRGAFSLALLVGGVNAACINMRPAPQPLSAEASAGSPQQIWTTKAGRGFTGQVALEDETFYGAGVDRKVYAVNLETGAIRWSSRLSGLVGGGIVLSGDTIFTATSRPQGRVYALERKLGKQLWRTGTGPIGAPLTLYQGVLIVPTQRGEVLGLDPKTGLIKWRRRVGVARIAATPADSGAVLLATVDSLYLIGASDGRVIRRGRSPGAILSPWVRLGDCIRRGHDGFSRHLGPAEGPQSRLASKGGRAGLRFPGCNRRYPVRGDAARHALPNRGRLGARRRRRWSRSIGPLRRRSPFSMGKSCSAGPTVESGRSRQKERKCGGFNSGGRSRSAPSRSPMDCWRWVATATCIGTADESRALRCDRFPSRGISGVRSGE